MTKGFGRATPSFFSFYISTLRHEKVIADMWDMTQQAICDLYPRAALSRRAPSCHLSVTIVKVFWVI